LFVYAAQRAARILERDAVFRAARSLSRVEKPIGVPFAAGAALY